MKTLLLKSILFVVVFSLTCCHGEKKNRQNEKTVIKIGAIFDLTGSLSYMGKWSYEGAQIALEDIKNNPKYKDYDVKLEIQDGETNPKKTVSAFEKIISGHDIPLVIGFNSSSGLLATAPIANKNKICIISSGAASPEISNAGKYIFRNRLSGAQEVREIASVAINKLKIKNMAILYINNDYGVDYKNIFFKSFEENGGEIIFVDAFEQDQSDFRSLLTKLKSFENLDGVYLIPYVKEGAKLLKQAKELNILVDWLSANAIEGPELIEIAGNAAEELTITVAEYSLNNNLTSAFNKKYKSKYGRDSEMFAANTYDAVFIALDAIIESGKNPKKILNYLHALKDFPGVSGKTNFDSNGDVIKSISLKKVINGKFEIIKK